eukprot:scaffold15216_cov41-Attheya_sp.AAC.2
MAIFSIWVTDMECSLSHVSDPGVILKLHEVEKKRKYLAHSRKRLASCLATKWKLRYSKVCGFVHN